ncbi:MAG: SurA N-terminal domain-containing protein [Rickettsiaceae bacterium]
MLFNINSTIKAICLFIIISFNYTSIYAIEAKNDKNHFAKNYDIVAIVNQSAITKEELDTQKSLMIKMGIDSESSSNDHKFTKLALEHLIDQELLFNYAENHRIKISDQDIESAISNIESNDNMSAGGIAKKIITKKLIDAFKLYVKSELIKQHILSEISQNANVTKQEASDLVKFNNAKDTKLLAYAFISQENINSKNVEQMKHLQRKLDIKMCKNTPEAIYKNFASKYELDGYLSSINEKFRVIIRDMKPKSISNILQIDDDLVVIMLCEKTTEALNSEEHKYVLDTIKNKKMSMEIKSFLNDLHTTSYIKIVEH